MPNSKKDQENISLVIGADGLIGHAISDYLVEAKEKVVETTHRGNTVSAKRLFLDLAEDSSSWSLPRHVSVAYHCAAVDSLERCLKNPTQSAKININSTVSLAKKLISSGAFFIFPSSNLVYDGSLSFQSSGSPPSPRTEHGRQKAEAERQLSALGKSISIVRFTKVFNSRMPLLQNWITALKKGEAIQPFSDKVISPVPLQFIVRVLHSIAKKRLAGIIQVSGGKDVAYADIARRLADHLGASRGLVQPISARESNLPLEDVPPHTTLDISRLIDEIGMRPPDVWSTIDEAIDENAKAANIQMVR
jgi:dTDP-4-dehydrorhamnose reductase